MSADNQNPYLNFGEENPHYRKRMFYLSSLFFRSFGCHLVYLCIFWCILLECSDNLLVTDSGIPMSESYECHTYILHLS